MAAAAAPAKLDVARLAFVSIPGGKFPSFEDDETGPTLVMEVREPEEEGPVQGIAARLAENDETIVLAPPMVEALGLPAVEEVWLFGPEGPCRADLGSPYATGYQQEFLALEVGYRLSPCADEFAPVAHVGPQPPPLRWVEAKVEDSEEITEPQNWEHVMQPILDAWARTQGSDRAGLVGALLDGQDVALVIATLRLQMYVGDPGAPETWTGPWGHNSHIAPPLVKIR
jgi:hypothetical protein